MSTSAGVEIEQNNKCRPISTVMRLITEKDGDLSACFDLIDETEGEFDNSSLKKILINNHTDANKGLVRDHLPLEYEVVFCIKVKKNNQRSWFELDLRTSKSKRDILYTTLGD